MPRTLVLLGRLPPLKVQRITAEELLLQVNDRVSEGKMVTSTGPTIVTASGSSPGPGASAHAWQHTDHVNRNFLYKSNQDSP